MRAICCLLLFLSVLLVAACGGERPPDRVAKTDRSVDRIITLAPHLAELVFSAGAGSHLIGVVEYSDFPATVLELPRVGDAFRLDYEAIIELAPDLILAWESGTPQEVIDRLAQLGFRVVSLETENLDGVAESLREIGQLVGNNQLAESAAAEFEHSLGELRAAAKGLTPVRIFYQVSAQPLFTISRQHVIGESIELCGGVNVFGGLDGISPAISPEAVIEAAPQAIIAARYTTDYSTATKQLDYWRQWASIPAVRDGHLFLVDANLMSRSSLRILDGIRELCTRIASARIETASGIASPGSF